MNSAYSIAFSVIVVCFLLTSTFYSSIYVFTLALLLFLIVAYARKQINITNIPESSIKSENYFCIALLLMFVSAIPPLLVNNSLSVSFRELDLPSKYLLFSLIALIFFKVRPHISRNILFITISLCGLLNGLIALIHLYIFPDLLYSGRVTGYTSITAYGMVCASLCIFTFLLFIYEHRFSYKLLFFVSSIFCIIGVVGSGVRGVMLAIGCYMLITLVFAWFRNRNLCKKIILSIVVFSITGFFVLKSMPSDRIEYTYQEISSISDGNYYTSIGLRLLMYREALAMFYLSPFIGLSAKSSLEKVDAISSLSKSPRILEEAKEGKPLYGKKHNDILNFMAHRGIIGLISLLFFYFCIALLFIRCGDNILGMIGGSLALLYFFAGLSGDPISGHTESTFFVITMLFILSARDV